MKMFLFIAGLLLFAACKKDKNDPPPEQAERIREILSPAEALVFLYDNEKKLTRINSDAGYSIRVTYLSSEIIVQNYFANDQPDPQSKYRFTVADGRITSGRKYLPNGAIVHEYVYKYDDQQRLSTVSFNIKDFTGNDSENSIYRLSYDAQNDLQQLLYKRSVVGVNADSSSVDFTRFAGKSFITWKNMGFDYFGKAAVAHQLQGHVVIPFSLVENLFPAHHAVKTVDSKHYRWNANTGTWGFHSGANLTQAESAYQYNNPGWLTKYLDYTVHWDD